MDSVSDIMLATPVVMSLIMLVYPTSSVVVAARILTFFWACWKWVLKLSQVIPFVDVGMEFSCLADYFLDCRNDERWVDSSALH